MTDFHGTPGLDQDRYRIIDEPSPGGMSRYGFNPFFAFLAVMLLGSTGFAAFLFNSMALNGPKKSREITLCVIGILSARLLGYQLGEMLTSGALPDSSAPYFFTLLTALRLGIGYFVFVSQAETHELRKYLKSLQERR